MEEKLEKIKNDGLAKLENAKTVEELQNIAKELTGKNRELGEVLKSISTLSNEEKNHYKNLGIEEIKKGKLAAVTMAGGQGTRLRT